MWEQIDKVTCSGPCAALFNGSERTENGAKLKSDQFKG